MNGRGFSLTIKELYKDRNMYRNPKIAKIFDRLPKMIDYALSENTEQIKQVKNYNKANNEDKSFYIDFELVA